MRLSKQEFYATYTFNLNPAQKYIILFKNAKTIKAYSLFLSHVPSPRSVLSSGIPSPPPYLSPLHQGFRPSPSLSHSLPPFRPFIGDSIPASLSLPPLPSPKSSIPPPSKKITIFVPLIQREFHSRPNHNNNGKRNLLLATTRCLAQTMHSTRNNGRQRQTTPLWHPLPQRLQCLRREVSSRLDTSQPTKENAYTMSRNQNPSGQGHARSSPHCASSDAEHATQRQRSGAWIYAGLQGGSPKTRIRRKHLRRRPFLPCSHTQRAITFND